MAYRPSKRSSRTIAPLEINIFPMMNLMVVLVPLLLSTATAIKIGVIELNLPQSVGGAVSETDIPKEAQRSLDLTITITKEGFIVSSSQAVLNLEETEGPTIPLIGDGRFHDYRIDVGSHPLWNGNITSLRMDPGGGAQAGEFAIEYIRAVR